MHVSGTFEIASYENANMLEDLSSRLDDMKDSMPDLNEQVGVNWNHLSPRLS